MRGIVMAAACGTVASATIAQPVLDGFRDALYAGPQSVQTVQTQFGDGNPDGGSELDAAYARVEGGYLYLLLTGNLENNFNKLNIFIDSRAGGQNSLQNADGFGGNNPTNDGWAGKHAGFTFDTGFDADYMLIVRNGFGGGDRFDIDFATIGGGAGAFVAAGDVFGGSLVGSNSNALPNGIGVAFDRSNTGGVIGGIDAADQAAAAAVTTGVEFAIPLSELGNPLTDIRISAMVNGSNHDYLSNQFLGGLTPPQGNLGGDGFGTFTGSVGDIDLNDFAGQQYFTVTIPAPAGLALLAIAAVPLRRRRA
ncbi:MAG: hypothetical protein IT431_02325 [Phycisphaerales bacterium]|nr:hypothetical protein [Phycisphaerales bacterium]